MWLSSSVSCTTGSGRWRPISICWSHWVVGEELDRDDAISEFIRLHYTRDDGDFIGVRSGSG